MHATPRCTASGAAASLVINNANGPEAPLRIAIIGSGIAGMTAAHLLHPRHEVHLFEAAGRPGGHANTVRVDLPGGPVAADTGFLVYNERTYPLFTRLLADLGVATHPSDMSFSLSDLRCGLEWRGTSLSTVFAQRRNATRPAFLAMLADVVRFNRLARRLLAEPAAQSGSLADLLAGRRWSAGFLDWYLIPLGSAIWSADPETFTQIPARTFAEFFSRHGLLGPRDQPPWRTVTGGSTSYVRAILEPLRTPWPAAPRRRRSPRCGVSRPGGVPHRARPGDLRPPGYGHAQRPGPGPAGRPERRGAPVLGALRYQPNRATLHTDASLLPANRRAWASWNYVHPDGPAPGATLTYYLNRLQGLQADQPVLVTLNRDEAIDPYQGRGALRLRAPHRRRGSGRRPVAPAAAQRGRGLLLRCLLGLRLPRRRGPQRPGRLRALRGAPVSALSPSALRSALYEGTVTHRRAEPDHRFTNRVALPLLFLDEMAELRAVHPLVDLDPSPHRRRRPAAMRFHRDDYLPSDAPTVEEAVEETVSGRGGFGARARWRCSATSGPGAGCSTR